MVKFKKYTYVYEYVKNGHDNEHIYIDIYWERETEKRETDKQKE